MPKDIQVGTMIGDCYKVVGELDRLPYNAPGGFARVWKVQEAESGEYLAFKVLRKEKAKPGAEPPNKPWYDGFVREVDLLTQLGGHPRVVDMLDFGFVWATGQTSRGTYDLLRPDGNGVEKFRSMMCAAMEDGWRPFLVTPICESKHSLHYRVSQRGGGMPLLMIEAMQFTLQLVDFIVELHEKEIVYWDAKPAHGYWDGSGMKLIDWNGSFRLQDPELKKITRSSADEIQALDLAIIARELIYPAFVGKDWRDGIAPQSLSTEDAADMSKEAAEWWQGEVDFYGCERILDEPVLDFLTSSVQSEAYSSATELQQAAKACARALGWECDQAGTGSGPGRAWRHKCRAITCLRTAHEQFLLAEKALEDAHVAHPGSPDTAHLDDETLGLRKRFERMGL